MKIKTGISVTLSLLALLLAACQQEQSSTAPQDVKTSTGATLLNFVEFEKSVEPYATRLIVTNKYCYDVIAVPGLMPDVVIALREFSELLASDSKVTFNTLPADLQKPCDISMNTFAPGRHLEFGFPIQEWSMNGSGRSLLDYQLDYQPDQALFVLPEDYRQFSVQEFREGRVMQIE
jgi:hypothetical protein